MIRHLWVVHDDGFAVLAMCMREAGVSYDPVYASMSTIKTILRPEVLTEDPSAPKPKHAGGRPKAPSKDKKAAKDAQKDATTGQSIPRASEGGAEPAPSPAAADPSKPE